MNTNDIIDDYVVHKFTLEELSVKYGKSISTMQRRLRQMRHIHTISKHKDVVILIDTTYWGYNHGLMVIKDAIRGKILWHKHVRHETVALYMQGIEWLQKNGFKIYGVVCDGLKGLFNALSDYNVQMCQVHQQRIIQRYLSQKSPQYKRCGIRLGLRPLLIFQTLVLKEFRLKRSSYNYLTSTRLTVTSEPETTRTITIASSTSITA